MSGTGAVAIGECMVELARGNDGRFGLSFGGDTFNTAVYLARCGVAVDYATALGDDPYSGGIIALAKAEGVGTGLITLRPGRTAGLYLIETSPAGERTFHYWRERAPAREALHGPGGETIVAALEQARVVYLSGITLSLYDAASLDRLAAALATARERGAMIAVDGNYRPRGWGGEAARARSTLTRFWRLATVALPTFEDEAMLWGDPTPADTLARLGAVGIGEIVVKLGPDGAVVRSAGDALSVPTPGPVGAVDTSAAGDSFNAAYLASRLAGADPEVAAGAGHRLAGIVVQHRGAIVPATATRAIADAIKAGRTL